LPAVSSSGGGAGGAAADDISLGGGTMVGWRVSNSIFSGHLRSDLIRMTAVALTCG
jgi:hypothetical protein